MYKFKNISIKKNLYTTFNVIFSKSYFYENT